MRLRLVFAILSTTLEEAALVIVVLWGLPQLDINIPLWVLPIIMVAWAFISVHTFRKGTLALKREHIVGLPNMIGTKGKVVSPLSPEGLVRIRGELWVAKSTGETLKKGRDIIVMDQERLKLLVEETQAKSGGKSHKTDG